METGGLISREPLGHGGMVILPFVATRGRQEVERIRGGCCPCPSGQWWFTYGGEDDERAEAAQRPRQEQRAQRMNDARPSERQTNLYELPQLQQPPQKSSQEPAAMPRREPQTPVKPAKRTQAVTLPPQPPPNVLGVQTRAAGGRAQSLTMTGQPSRRS